MLHLKVEDPPSSHTLSWVASEHSACREDALSVGDPWLGRQALLELSPARRALALLGGRMGAALSWGAPLRMSQALQSSASIIWCSRLSWCTWPRACTYPQTAEQQQVPQVVSQIDVIAPAEASSCSWTEGVHTVLCCGDVNLNQRPR